MIRTKRIESFSGEYDFLSNFYPAIVTYNGVIFSTVEHAYQAAKSIDLTEQVKIQQVKYPGTAKSMGRKIKIRPDWEQIKIDIMTDLVRQKFREPGLRAKLLATDDAALIEGNTWGDKFWGMVIQDGFYIGQNQLGKILMQVREEIKNG